MCPLNRIHPQEPKRIDAHTSPVFLMRLPLPMAYLYSDRKSLSADAIFVDLCSREHPPQSLPPWPVDVPTHRSGLGAKGDVSPACLVDKLLLSGTLFLGSLLGSGRRQAVAVLGM